MENGKMPVLTSTSNLLNSSVFRGGPSYRLKKKKRVGAPYLTLRYHADNERKSIKSVCVPIFSTSVTSVLSSSQLWGKTSFKEMCGGGREGGIGFVVNSQYCHFSTTLMFCWRHSLRNDEKWFTQYGKLGVL